MADRTEKLNGFLKTGEVDNPLPNAETQDPVDVSVATSPKRQTSREGKRMASVFLDTEAHNQLSILKIETGLSLQELQIQGLNLLFQSYNKPPIAK